MISAAQIQQSVSAALGEDIGSGDLTAMLIAETQSAQATVISRQDTVLCGTQWFDEVFRQLDKRISIHWCFQDGARVNANAMLCELQGPARAILSGERTALNFLQTLSATATRAREFVDAVAGTSARILDTRKTIPGLRHAQKYAAHCGGAVNHRMGLYDAILIKENHLKAAGSIAAAVQQAKRHNPHTLIEVEIETLDQLAIALTQPVDRILLDNMNLDELKQAVHLSAGNIPLEASGGVSLTNVRQIALTGVDYISVGEITKHIQAVDLSMRFT